MANDYRNDTFVDWHAMGVEWRDDVVNDGNDRALMPHIVDWKRFAAHVGDERMTAIINVSTSLWVACQQFNRTAITKSHGFEWVRRTWYNHVMGMRARVTITRRPLPGGEWYTGNVESEYRSTYAAALVDAGVDGTLAFTNCVNDAVVNVTWAHM